eukprot:TRINITY_DN304_c0_g1_i1.p1 TRINITY_DN304_c0_g1~~TRINITY_DN304_c0_g1_i1.p1  ORF type:complete len:737 (-),score=174.77 TRINITY_DN304_c0_g1_i1:151-2361(-)
MKKKIERLLVANRGEIACRIIRTCRKLSIATVAVYSHADRNSPFVTLADEAVFLGASPSPSSYLNADKLLQIALERRVDAIHPGYGFLSENAEFCKKVEEAGLVFVGPTSDAIASMGSKIGAKRLLQAKEGSAVPLIPGYQGEDQTDERLVKEALRVGFPVLLKASAGGGGRGMRVVRKVNNETSEQLEKRLREAISSARTESQNAFGDGTLLIERYFDRVKHIEIQIVGDAYGELIHLFERECSVQRRHQKVIEESPSPIMTPELRKRMGSVAVTIGKAIKYRSLGTVEFIVDAETHDFYFLEVNTRLQVEHPVTEAITGLDLVEVQLRIAEGLSLTDLHLTSSLTPGEPAVEINGHAIEVRLYAEDPLNNFFPCTGTLLLYKESSLPGMRYDSGITSGSEISIYYDPMVSKVIAHSKTRQEAITRMNAALSSTVVLGFQTNKLFLRQVLQNPVFQRGDFDTGFIDAYLPHDERIRLTKEEFQPQVQQLIGSVALLIDWIRRNKSRGVLKHVPSGWRNNFSAPQRRSFLVGTPSSGRCAIEATELNLEYNQLSSSSSSSLDSDVGLHTFEIKSNTSTDKFVAIVHDYKAQDTSSTSISHDWLDASINGIRRQYHIAAESSSLNYPHGDSVFHIHSEGLGIGEYRVVLKSPFNIKASDADGANQDEKFSSPMPGKILKLLVADQTVVTKGDPIVVMESMKMETKVTAHRSGVVSFKCKEGDLVEENVALFLIQNQK